MKITYAIAATAAGYAAFTAIAQQQQQSPYEPPAVVAQPTQPAQQTTMGAPIVLSLSGVTVTDQAGQAVGPLQNIILTPAGCVDTAVVSLGGQKLVPIPWMLVSGSGATRNDTATAGRAAFTVKLDRQVLMQAPSVTAGQITQLTQPQMMQQVQNFYTQYTTQNAAGGTGSQTGVNVGGNVNATNHTTAGVTNQDTNLSPTGPTNARPGRPAFETNRPPYGRPPVTRPPTNRPPAGAGYPGATPNAPGQPPALQPGQ